MNKNKIVLVTGGTGEIGTALCKALSQKGYKVCANYLFDEELEKFNKETKGFSIDCFKGDVSNFVSCSDMINEIKEKKGSIDILINNVGIAKDSALKKMPEDYWKQVISVNLNSVFNVTRNVINDMIEKKWGRIVCTSSVVGHMGQRGISNYAATKSAMYGFCKSLAQEVARHNITVNTISPGYMDTSLARNIKKEVRDKIMESVPMERFGALDELVHAFEFLVDDRASYITGIDINVSGGKYM